MAALALVLLAFPGALKLMAPQTAVRWKPCVLWRLYLVLDMLGVTLDDQHQENRTSFVSDLCRAKPRKVHVFLPSVRAPFCSEGAPVLLPRLLICSSHGYISGVEFYLFGT